MVSSVSSPGKAVVTPAAEARIIYVSASTGDDANDGLSPEAAVASITRGEHLVRDSSPDWMLLKRGDRWQAGLDDWHKRGRSAEQPMIIGAYGSGPRPLMKSPTAFAPELSLEHVTVIGVQFVADARLRAAAALAGSASRRIHPVPPLPGVVRRAGEPDRAPVPSRVEPTRPGHIADDSIITGAPFAAPPRPQPGHSPAAAPPTFGELGRAANPGDSAAPSASPRIFSDAAAVADLIPSPAEALRPAPRPPSPLARPMPTPSAVNRLGAIAPLAPLAQRINQQSLALPLRVKRIALGRDDTSLIINFTSDVAAGIDRSDLLLSSTDGTIIDATALAVSCDSTGRVATWTFPGLPGQVLPAGAWRVTLRAAITDAQGQQLDGQADGIGGEDYVNPRRILSRGVSRSAPCRATIERLPRRAAA